MVNNCPFKGSATVTTNYVTLATVVVGKKTVEPDSANNSGGERPPGYVVNLEIANGSGQTLSDTKIQLQDHPDGEFYDYLGGADFTTATIVAGVLFATQTHKITTAVDGSSGHAHVYLDACYAFRIQSKLAAGSGTVTAYGNVRAA